MSKTITQLEEELASAKKLEQQNKWEIYLNETEKYLKSLVGKTFVKPYSNGAFCMFKVTGYKTSYYADRDGFYGQWSPSRWFKLESTAMINCRVADNSGNWFRGGIHYHNLKFKVVKGKSKDSIEISKLNLVDFEKEKYTHMPSEIREFGKLSYESNKPNFTRDRNDFSIFLREAPEGMWEEAKKIADQNLIDTKKFWDIYEPKVREL